MRVCLVIRVQCTRALLVSGTPSLGVTFDLLVNDPVWRLPVCERLLRWTCSAHTVCVLECHWLLVLTCTIGIVCGLPVVVSQKTSLKNRMVLSGILISGSNCHTPAAEMIEWEWLVIFYLVWFTRSFVPSVASWPPTRLCWLTLQAAHASSQHHCMWTSVFTFLQRSSKSGCKVSGFMRVQPPHWPVSHVCLLLG